MVRGKILQGQGKVREFYFTTFRGSHTSLKGRSSILVELEFGSVGYSGRREFCWSREKTHESPRSKARTNNKLNPDITVSQNRLNTVNSLLRTMPFNKTGSLQFKSYLDETKQRKWSKIY